MRLFTSSIVTIAVAAACVIAPRPASAQSAANPIDQPRFVFGPIGLVPTVAIKDAGIDSNVFNTADDPRQDYTATLTTSLDAGMRVARARVRAKGRLDYVSFAHTVSENSLNGTASLRIDVPLGRITPTAWYAALKTRHRPGFEIDARARRFEQTAGLGVDLRISGKTTVNASAQRLRIAFDGDQFFLGTNLRDVLDRDQDSATLSLRYAVTPLTTIIVQSEGRRDRFAYTPQRDADSMRGMTGFEFDALAMITGSALVGVKRFEPYDPQVPAFRGPVVFVTVGTRLGPRLKLTLDAQRDVDYSFDRSRPYYVSNSGVASVSLGVTSAWDLVARGGRYQLQRFGGIASSAADREEIVDIAGGGIGYRFSRSRIGIDADLTERFADRTSRRYHSLRIATSITHAF